MHTFIEGILSPFPNPTNHDNPFRASQLRVKRLEVHVDAAHLNEESPDALAVWSRMLSVFYPSELRISCGSPLDVFYDDDAADFVGMVLNAVRLTTAKRIVALEMPEVNFDRSALAAALGSLPALEVLEVAHLSLQSDSIEDSTGESTQEGSMKPHEKLRRLSATMNEPMGRLWDLFDSLPALERLDGRVVVWIRSAYADLLKEFLEQHGRLRDGWALELSGQDSQVAIDLPPASHGPFRQVDALAFAEYSGNDSGAAADDAEMEEDDHRSAEYISTADQLVAMLHAASETFPRVKALHVFLSSSCEMFASPEQCAAVRSAFEVGWPHLKSVTLSVPSDRVYETSTEGQTVSALAQAARCFPRRMKLSVSSVNEPAIIAQVNALNGSNAELISADLWEMPYCG